MDNLIAFVEDEESKADLEQVEESRALALQYYLPNKPLGNEIEGRSGVVLRDVFDTIEWMKPALLKIFASGSEIVKFVPRGAEDMEAAEQETEYINYIATQKNNAFLVFHDWITDALLHKNGYVKVTVVDEPKTTEKYEGLSQEEVALLAQTYDIVSAETIANEMGEFYTVEMSPKSAYKCIKLHNLRPESVRVSASFRGLDMQDCAFFEHAEYKTLSELRSMGLQIEDDINDNYGESYQQDVDDERREIGTLEAGDDSLDPASRQVLAREVWCNYDANEDGIAERLHLVIVGRDILLQESASVLPIATLAPIRVPHRHTGISIADLVEELQVIRSTLLRNALDQQYLQNHGRHAIDMNRVNLEDMLVSKPGGIVRVQGDPGSAIFPLVSPVSGQGAVQMIEYMDTVRENRTGITKYNQGLDSNSLNKTATGINAIQNAAQQRIELIARMFAETGVKELFWLVHYHTFKYVRKTDIIRLRNKWTPIDPSQWKERRDLTVTVGLGMGNKDQQIQQIQGMLSFMQGGMQAGIVTPKNLYHAATKYVELMGWKDSENWVTDPTPDPNAPPPEPPPDPNLVKVQQEGQMKQAQLQQDGQIKQAQMQQAGQIEQAKLQADGQIKQMQVEAEIGLKQWEAEQRMALEKELAILKVQTEREVAMIREQNNAQQAQQQTTLKVDSLDSVREFAAENASGIEAKVNEVSDKLEGAIAQLAQIAQTMTKPKKIVRDQSGRVSGVE